MGQVDLNAVRSQKGAVDFQAVIRQNGACGF